MKYHVIGIMSGTSLDGVDLACCIFEKIGEQWSFEIPAAETIPYTADWRQRLACAGDSTAFDLVRTDIEYGHLLGLMTRDFIRKYNLSVDFIASHGHTIFHRPGQRVTWQIGKGAAISAETGLPVCSDFRSLDVALGGQGAPLVPVGDQLLFHNFRYCLNLGGFANVSCELDGRRVAFDICPVNIVLNEFAGQLGLEYDRDGMLAASGNTNADLLKALNSLHYYQLPFPKSLGKEWVDQHIHPLVIHNGLSAEDNLATFTEHIADQISHVLAGGKDQEVLVTGGGACNKFLVNKIKGKTLPSLVIPDQVIVQYKEALIFAFLGVLKFRGENNCLSSVTGALKDSAGGFFI